MPNFLYRPYKLRPATEGAIAELEIVNFSKKLMYDDATGDGGTNVDAVSDCMVNCMYCCCCAIPYVVCMVWCRFVEKNWNTIVKLFGCRNANTLFMQTV